MNITEEQNISIQAGFDELRSQRDVLSDRCTILAQQNAVQSLIIRRLETELDRLNQPPEPPPEEGRPAAGGSAL